MLSLNQRNIHSIFVQANASDVAIGESWYMVANEICQRIADANNIELRKVVGVMAALSPRCKWEKNISLTEEAIAIHRSGVGRLGCIQANAKKAFEILDGAEPMLVLGGYKVNAFYLNILKPETSNEVTVDTHAISIWMGTRANDKLTAPIFSSFKKYSAIAEDYRAVANEVGVMPHQVQAITWVTWKRLNNI